MGEMARLAPEFDDRGTKVIALSCDHLANHQGWIQDVKVGRVVHAGPIGGGSWWVVNLNCFPPNPTGGDGVRRELPDHCRPWA